MRERVAAVARVRRAVAAAADRRGVIAPGEVVVVACSGGPDSTALVDALARLAPPRGWRLHVVHVDHGLRPGSAAEALTVAELASRLRLDFEGVTVEVGAGPSLQDQARRARYRGLAEVADRVGATAIALGHTADDQAETVLMRLLTSATPWSLRAMAEREGRLARPLLRIWREATLAYCAALGLEPLDDPSNRDPRFLRSRVRHELLPALEGVFPGARRRLATLADRQRELQRQPPAEPGPAPAGPPPGGPVTSRSRPPRSSKHLL
ncbi:MAG: tRNA lysidine(34) synthetase TilS [Candidatus Dormibacteria bacterium]